MTAAACLLLALPAVQLRQWSQVQRRQPLGYMLWDLQLQLTCCRME